jgi:hypothetical protein
MLCVSSYLAESIRIENQLCKRKLMKLYTDFPLGLMVDHILDVDRLELELVLLMTGTGWQDAGIDTGTLRT